MNTFRFFWTAHKWVGISAAVFLLMIAVTGFLLLIKKDVTWIQPPTQAGTTGGLEAFLPLDQVWERIEAVGHPDFRVPEDVDRIDVRPALGVYKVRSKRGNSEIQVDAVRGTILSQGTRRSDWIESLHDGSWIGRPVHDYLMPLVALCLLFLVLSGLWIWCAPILKRRRRRRARAAQADGRAPPT